MQLELRLQLKVQLEVQLQLQLKLEKVVFVRRCLLCFSAGHIIMMCSVRA